MFPVYIELTCTNDEKVMINADCIETVRMKTNDGVISSDLIIRPNAARIQVQETPGEIGWLIREAIRSNVTMIIQQVNAISR